MNIRAVLVPVDFSEYSEKAFIWALDMAEKWKAMITLLHVVPTPPYSPVVMGSYFDPSAFERNLLADAETSARALIDRQAKRSVPTGIKVCVGEPFQDICRIAKEERIDIIIMGSHGRTGLSHIVLGSVAERVVRHAPCPVLVVSKIALSQDE
jgi:universal stress protein A